MCDGLPLGFGEDGLEGNRHVAEHVNREAEHIGEQLLVRGTDLVVLDNDGQCSQCHQTQHRCDDAAGPTGQRLQLARPTHEATRGEQQAHHRANHAQHGKRTQHQGEVDAGEITFANRAFQQCRAIITEYLQESLAPTQTLTPTLREGNRLLVVEDRSTAIANLKVVF